MTGHRLRTQTLSRTRRSAGALGALVLVLLMLQLAAPRTAACTVYGNLAHIALAKGALADAPFAAAAIARDAVAAAAVSPPTASAATGQLAAAGHWFTAAQAAGCPPAGLTLGLGQAYAARGQFDASRAILQTGPTDRPALRDFQLAQVYDALGQPAAAWALYATLPRDAAAHFHRLGAAAEQAGDYDAALHYFAIATLINPHNPKSRYAAAFVAWQRASGPPPPGLAPVR